MVGKLNQSDLCMEVYGGAWRGAQRYAQRCIEVCTEVHGGGDKNQDFMIIRLVNANDLIGYGGDT